VAGRTPGPLKSLCHITKGSVLGQMEAEAEWEAADRGSTGNNVKTELVNEPSNGTLRHSPRLGAVDRASAPPLSIGVIQFLS